ncbi:MAG: hypothetical protein ORO03_01375, partial [Alphaproteobacteria bacterium]|nr:hypothetical protein [Alphaproteobacteria bacterium]
LFNGNTTAIDVETGSFSATLNLSKPATDTSAEGVVKKLEITNSDLNWVITGVASPILLNAQFFTDSTALLGSISVTTGGTKAVSGITTSVPIEISNGALSGSATPFQSLKTIITTGSITVTGTSYFDNSIFLKAGTAITQGEPAVAGGAVTGKTLSLKAGSVLSLQAGSSVLLRDTGNDLKSLGQVTAGGLVTVVNAASMNLAGNITSSGKITIDLSAANGAASVAVLGMLQDVTTRGGELDLKVGTAFGRFTNKDVNGAVTTARKLRTSGSDVYLNFKTFGGSVISNSDSVVFDLSDSFGTRGFFNSSSASLTNPTLGTGTRIGFYSSNTVPTDDQAGLTGTTTWYDVNSYRNSLPENLNGNSFNGISKTVGTVSINSDLVFYKVNTDNILVGFTVTGDVKFLGVNNFGGGLAVSVTGTNKTIVQADATGTDPATDNNSRKLTIGSGWSVNLTTVSGAITLDGVGNSLKKLGAVTAGTTTAAALTIYTAGNLELSGDLLGTTITIDQTKGGTAASPVADSGNLSLLSSITTKAASGVTVTLGRTGQYISNTNKWSTDGGNLTMNLAGYSLGSEALSFDLAKGVQVGTFTSNSDFGSDRLIISDVVLSVPSGERNILSSKILDGSKVNATRVVNQISTTGGVVFAKSTITPGASGELQISAGANGVQFTAVDTEQVNVQGSLKLTTTGGGTVTQTGAGSIIVSGTLTVTTTGLLDLGPAGISGNSIAKLGAISASSVAINNLGAPRTPGALTLTGDITTAGALQIDTSGDLILAPTTGNEIKINGGGTVKISVGGDFKDGGKQLGFYATSNAGSALSTGTLSLVANSWTQTVTGSLKSIKTGGQLSIAKTYTGGANGTGNLWLRQTLGAEVAAGDEVITSIPANAGFDVNKIEAQNSATITNSGLTYTGSGILYIDGYQVPVGNTTNIGITATRFKIGNISGAANPVQFGGNLKLTITGTTTADLTQNAALSVGGELSIIFSDSNNNGNILLDHSLNTIAKLGNMTSFGSISITNASLYDANTEVALKFANNTAISLNGAFNLTAAGAIELGGATTITGAKPVSGSKSVTITAAKFSDKTFTLTLAQAAVGPQPISAQFTVTTWDLTAGSTSIAIQGSASTFSAATIYDGKEGVVSGTGGNLYITSSSNLNSQSYRAGKAGKFISQLPGTNSSLRGKITIDGVAATNSNFMGTGVSYTGSGKVFIDGFQDSSSTSDYLITANEIVFGNGTASGTASNFGRNLTLLTNGGGNLGVSQTSVGSTLGVVGELSVQIRDSNGDAAPGAISLSHTNNSIATLGVVSGGSVTIASSSALAVNGAMTSSTGAISLTTTGAMTIAAALNSGANLTLNANGTVTIAGTTLTSSGRFALTAAGLTLTTANVTVAGATAVSVRLSGAYTDGGKTLAFSNGSMVGAVKFIAGSWAMTATTSISVAAGNFDSADELTQDIYVGGTGEVAGALRYNGLSGSNGFDATKVSVAASYTKSAPELRTNGTIYLDGVNLTDPNGAYRVTAAKFVVKSASTIAGTLELITTAGGITQQAGLTVSSLKLTTAGANGDIVLTSPANAITNLLAVSSGGDVRIATTGNMTLKGDISAGAGKLVNLMGSLVLGRDVLTNADTYIAIGAGAFVNAGFKLEAATDKNISFSFNDSSTVTLTGTTAFKVTGTGWFWNGVKMRGNGCIGNLCLQTGNAIGDAFGSGDLTVAQLGQVDAPNKTGSSIISSDGTLSILTSSD